MSASSRSTQLGFTLIEVTVAVTVLAVSVLAILGLGTLSTRFSQENERQTVALGLARGKMEAVRLLAYDDVALLPEGALPREEVVQQNDQVYFVMTDVTLVDDPGGQQDAYKKVQTTVEWNTPDAGKRTIKLVSYATASTSQAIVPTPPPPPLPSTPPCIPGSLCPNGFTCSAEGECPVDGGFCPLIDPIHGCRALYSGSAGTLGKVFRYDGGTTWLGIGDLVGSNKVTALTGHRSSPLDILTLYAGTSPNGRVYRQDGKNTWADLGQLGSAQAVTALASYTGNLFAGTSSTGTVYRHDGGTSWTSVGQPGGSSTTTINDLTVYGGYLYAATGPVARIWRYQGGTTWLDVSGVLATEAEALSLVAHYDGALYAGLSNGQVFRALGGNSWTAVERPGGGSGPISALQPFNNGKLYAAHSLNLPLLFRYEPVAKWVQAQVVGSTVSLNDIGVFDTALHVATESASGGEVYRYNATNDQWASTGTLSGATAATELAVAHCRNTDCPTGYVACNNTCVLNGATCPTPVPSPTPTATLTPSPTVSPSGSATPPPTGCTYQTIFLADFATGGSCTMEGFTTTTSVSQTDDTATPWSTVNNGNGDSCSLKSGILGVINGGVAKTQVTSPALTIPAGGGRVKFNWKGEFPASVNLNTRFYIDNNGVIDESTETRTDLFHVPTTEWATSRGTEYPVPPFTPTNPSPWYDLPAGTHFLTWLFRLQMTEPYGFLDPEGQWYMQLDNITVETCQGAPSACSDGVDNDLDGPVDLADTQCSSSSGTSEGDCPPGNIYQCNPGTPCICVHEV
jgi:prepilin-type N-terminal cleavage/methylation domain-containing protein